VVTNRDSKAPGLVPAEPAASLRRAVKGCTRLEDCIRNEDIREKLKVQSVQNKYIQTKLD
jgi:hypothetical protein